MILFYSGYVHVVLKAGGFGWAEMGSKQGFRAQTTRDTSFVAQPAKCNKHTRINMRK